MAVVFLTFLVLAQGGGGATPPPLMRTTTLSESRALVNLQHSSIMWVLVWFGPCSDGRCDATLPPSGTNTSGLFHLALCGRRCAWH